MSIDETEEGDNSQNLKRPLKEDAKAKAAKKKKLTPAQNALAKADRTGMKSISSFFGKKG
ncbi:hypothetical protein HK097_005135 [Rhizophlyctis rosea]|uniref:Uncharacterized protein n=1 Tax=Rhizophlyctis rosea TaxID=64517 RepID=A0AAD5SFQ7_9FUNG|nr:hypothetical protein HK097_005135 [Rhizophlyctis rosea]